MKFARFMILVCWYLAMSCATQTTPMGGPKDSIPPTVAEFRPEQNATNFKGKEITVEFSEAIQLNNPKEQIIIIPSTGKKTDFKLKGANTLVITPENPLRDSTTYNISFREAIKDITEGNFAKLKAGEAEQDLHLAFSTGPVIDTLMIAGRINGGLTDQIPEDITIALYQTDTFDIFADMPDYFTKTSKDGRFQITNLKAGKYRLYAFGDKNKNLKAETRSEKFGFLADTIRLDSMVRTLRISLVNIDTRQPKLTSARNQSTINVIRFNKSMTDYELIAHKKLIAHFANNQTEIIAYYPDSLIKVGDSVKLFSGIDSTMVNVRAIDSTLQIVDTLVYIKRDAREKIKEGFTASATEATYNLDNNTLEFSMSVNKPLKALNVDSMYLQYDSATRIPIKLKSLKFDTAFNRVSIKEPIFIDSLPQSPKITIAKGYFVSIDNDTSKQITSTMKLLDMPTTATLMVEAQTKEPHYIIQLINGAGKVVQQAVDQKKMTFKYLIPELLKIRAIIDTNGNGSWDTAIYPENREPEKVVYFLNTNKKPETPLRANWEVGPLIFRF